MDELEVRVRTLESRADKQAAEIVALKGLVTALLSESAVPSHTLEVWVREACRNPVGFAHLDAAMEAAVFPIESSGDARVQNMP